MGGRRIHPVHQLPVGWFFSGLIQMEIFYGHLKQSGISARKDTYDQPTSYDAGIGRKPLRNFRSNLLSLVFTGRGSHRMASIMPKVKPFGTDANFTSRIPPCLINILLVILSSPFTEHSGTARTTMGTDSCNPTIKKQQMPLYRLPSSCNQHMYRHGIGNLLEGRFHQLWE